MLKPWNVFSARVGLSVLTCSINVRGFLGGYRGRIKLGQGVRARKVSKNNSTVSGSLNQVTALEAPSLGIEGLELALQRKSIVKIIKTEPELIEGLRFKVLLDGRVTDIYVDAVKVEVVKPDVVIVDENNRPQAVSRGVAYRGVVRELEYKQGRSNL